VIKKIFKFITAFLICILCSCSSKALLQPDREIRRNPTSYGLNYSEVEINSNSENKIKAWFLPAQNKTKNFRAKATVIFLHARDGNISTHFYRTIWLLSKGYNVLIPDYRGYGESEGESRIEDIYLDLDSIVAFVAKNESLGKIVLWGQDIGASMAIYLAANSFNKSNICMSLAEGTIPSFRAEHRSRLSDNFILKPFSKILSKSTSNILDAEKYVESASPTPLFFAHGTKDQVVNIREARKLYYKAKKPKKFWEVKGARHLNSFYNNSARQDILAKHIDSYCVK